MWRVVFVGAWVLAGWACGARTEPPVDPPRRVDSGRPDTGTPPSDAGMDAPPPVDAEICGGDCDDGIFCNGEEYCTEDFGCFSPGPPDCDDGDECTEDRCDPRTDMCVNVMVDLDRDRDGVTSCTGDCDDTDARVFPGATEVCDMVDQDCDGRADEGTLSECRDCRPGCSVVTLPDETGGDWEDLDGERTGVRTAPDGTLRLGETRSETSFAWIANTRYGTLTKLDLRTGAQSAEYDSVLNDGTNGAPPAGEECDTEGGGGNCPSRTAVDLRGNVYVGNRAFRRQGTVTKIAGNESDCIDRNGNGRIDTSRDVDGDGIIEAGVRGEYLGQDDECILWTVDVGGPGSTPRAVAIDAGGNVWVGLWQEARVVQLAPGDGRRLRTVNLRRYDNFQPYGAAIGGDGTVWFVSVFDGRMIGIDAGTGVVVRETQAFSESTSCRGGYGIAVDMEDRVWVAGLQCEMAFRYDPEEDEWTEVVLPFSGTRGIAADDRGYVYVSSSHTYLHVTPLGSFSAGDPITRVTRFRADDGSDLRVFGMAPGDLPGLGTVGVGLDSDRNVWLVNQDSSSITRVNPETGESREFPVGDMPYTYSDFTGFALRTFTVPNGFLRTVIEGCAAGPTEWETLSWEGTTPAGTNIEVRVRAAATRAGLGSATWVGPFTEEPVDLFAPPGPVASERFLEVEITLTTEDESRSPRLEDLSIQLNCPAG